MGVLMEGIEKMDRDTFQDKPERTPVEIRWMSFCLLHKHVSLGLVLWTKAAHNSIHLYSSAGEMETSVYCWLASRGKQVSPSMMRDSIWQKEGGWLQRLTCGPHMHVCCAQATFLSHVCVTHTFFSCFVIRNATMKFLHMHLSTYWVIYRPNLEIGIGISRIYKQNVYKILTEITN